MLIRKKETFLWIIISFIWITGLTYVQQVDGAEAVIQIPGDHKDEDGTYRLEYFPPLGLPRPNNTFYPYEISQGISLTRAQPGTKYKFILYYTNGTVNEWPTFHASITTQPAPPGNLSILVRGDKTVQVLWDPPEVGGYSSFKLKLIPLTDDKISVTSVLVSEVPYSLMELTPGGSYELQLYTIYDNKESAAYISTNFTTRPNAPGRFIVWYRNGTTMLVLWQPPYPAGIYSHYRVSIDPSDAEVSILNVTRKGNPPGPAQAAFHGLVPGREYNITVETVSIDQISLPTTAAYRTIPPTPRNVTFDAKSFTSESFTAQWDAPKGIGEYDLYRISLATGDETQELEVPSDGPRRAVFDRNLKPGRTYRVLVKTVSGNVPSWPTSGNVTTRPLPVILSHLKQDDVSDEVEVNWSVSDGSKQDQFKVVYQEVGSLGGDSRTSVTPDNVASTSLYPGRNYSVSVFAVSNGMESEPTIGYFLTRPASPIIKELKPIDRGLNFSWKSDVTSRQDEFVVIYTRNDTGESLKQRTEEPKVHLENLLPGASYEIKVFAISHGLQSEPHTYFHSVYPNPVRNLTFSSVSKTALVLNWEPPIDSLFSSYVVKYKTFDINEWLELTPSNLTSKTVPGLIPGKRYMISVWSVSNKIECLYPQQLQYTVAPNTVHDVTLQQDSRNITFEWPRPDGRIDSYTIIWWKTSQPDKKASKEIPGNRATEGIDRKLFILIGELFPGEDYKFEIYTSAHDINSEIFKISARTRPIITSEILIVKTREETRFFTVSYTPTPQNVAKFDKYRFQLTNESIPMQEKAADDKDTKVVFNNLVPGRLYIITAWTVSGNVTSQALKRQERLYPQPVTQINATDVSDTEITLAWNKPEGEMDSFEVQYLNAENQLSINETKWFTMTIGNLRPHRNYTFTVLTKSGTNSPTMRQSGTHSVTFTTRESTPGKVQEFTAVKVRPNSIDLKWALPPNEKNGVLLGYQISYKLKGTAFTEEKQFGPDDRVGTIESLIPGKEYIFEIEARTKIGSGRIRKFHQKMPIDAPPKPSHQVFPTEKDKTASTITVRYRKNYFSNQFGIVTGYAVIVAEDVNVETNVLEMSRWRDVQKYSAWPPYQVTKKYYPFNSSNTLEDFIIGDEEGCLQKQDYCNGPLKPGTTYRIKVRAFTAPNKFADTFFSHPIETDAAGNTVAVAFGVLSALLLIVVVGVIVFRYRRGLCQSIKERNVTNSNGEEIPFPSNMLIERSRPCKLMEFPDHYRFMSADSDFRFSDEYEALSNIGRDHLTSAADLPVNRTKNRFTNILPYDHSRVKLPPSDDEDGSDYINANFVPGYGSPREFIVTQGPLVSTRDDFWRMCWETNSVAIVMLTRTVEKGREKCDHYWPFNMMPVCYGDIEVTILNESNYRDWNVSEFRICKGEKCRVIIHFYFTTWPDFGVPDPPQTLVRFVRAFRERVSDEQKPIVVHCSAGVGRSGTFIALDRLLKTINHSDYVDIFGIVCQMRNERVYMVQNEQQYICIHQCLLAVLEGRENEQPPTLEIHDNQGFDDDEGIAEAVM